MTNLMPSDIVDEVRNVLQNAQRGKGHRPNYLTAFQILDRLPSAIRERLIRERDSGGQGAGPFAATGVVSQAAMMLVPQVQIEYMDSVGLSVQIEGKSITPSNVVCGLYRWAGIDEEIA